MRSVIVPNDCLKIRKFDGKHRSKKIETAYEIH